MNRTIIDLMFNYQSFTEDEIISTCKEFPPKIIRWLGENHCDNKTRKIFFKITGISIGEDTVINKNFIVSDDYENLLHLGDRVAISPNVTVICASGPNNSKLNYNAYVSNNLIVKKKVVINDDVWIGANVTILPGITIGRESVIAAGSVVTKDIPERVIAAGIPAKTIRNI